VNARRSLVERLLWICAGGLVGLLVLVAMAARAAS
jgi:hypothetical protein